MATNVYANGMEISGKASPNKVIASMPDVCLSPPTPPAGPIPIPYPNFSSASDTTDGTQTVKIGGEEVGLKGKSSYKKSTGDEAATKTLGMGVISHNITGPVKHKAGSFTVKFEGSCVVRFMDITTGNHLNPGDGCVSPDVAQAAIANIPEKDCEELRGKNAAKRKELEGDDPQGSTVTHSTVKPPGEEGWSYSRALAEKYKNGTYKEGLSRVDTGQTTKSGQKVSDVQDAKGRKGADASNMCEKARQKFRYESASGNSRGRSSARPHTSHTESRIIESLFAKGTPPRETVVTMAIDWNNQGTPDSDPCNRCRLLLCAAQECGIIIALCDENNKAMSVEDKTGEDCP